MDRQAINTFISVKSKFDLVSKSIISQSVPALQACQSHQQNPGVLEDPGIQDLQQVPALLSHQQDPENTRERALCWYDSLKVGTCAG